MNKNTAIDVLIQVARLAQKTGVLSLEDAAQVLVAIKVANENKEGALVEDNQDTTEQTTE